MQPSGMGFVGIWQENDTGVIWQCSPVVTAVVAGLFICTCWVVMCCAVLTIMLNLMSLMYPWRCATGDCLGQKQNGLAGL